MVTYRIYPLAAGKIGELNLAASPMPEILNNIICPALVFYLGGGPRKILVDTGVIIPGMPEHFNSLAPLEARSECLIKALMEIGLSPKDIDIVVLTRINQAANIDLFPQARIIIQKKEWEHALNSMQFRPFVKKLENSRLYLADDGYQVSEGVRLISVPGYSEGQQAVVVDTTAGPYVLAGGLTHALAYIDQTAYITDIFGRRIACTTASDLDFKQAIIYTDLEAWNNIITHIFKKVSGCQRIISSYDPDLTEKVLP